MDLFRKKQIRNVIFACLILAGLNAATATPITKKNPKHVKTLLTIATPSPSPTPVIPDRHLKYYEIGKTDAPPIYTQTIESQRSPTGELTAKVTVKDTDG